MSEAVEGVVAALRERVDEEVHGSIPPSSSTPHRNGSRFASLVQTRCAFTVMPEGTLMSNVFGRSSFFGKASRTPPRLMSSSMSAMLTVNSPSSGSTSQNRRHERRRSYAQLSCPP